MKWVKSMVAADSPVCLTRCNAISNKAPVFHCEIPGLLLLFFEASAFPAS